jgi:hypothetical protein
VLHTRVKQALNDLAEANGRESYGRAKEKSMSCNFVSMCLIIPLDEASHYIH